MAVLVQSSPFSQKSAPFLDQPLSPLKSQNKTVFLKEVNPAEGAYGIARLNVDRFGTVLE